MDAGFVKSSGTTGPGIGRTTNGCCQGAVTVFRFSRRFRVLAIVPVSHFAVADRSATNPVGPRPGYELSPRRGANSEWVRSGALPGCLCALVGDSGSKGRVFKAGLLTFLLFFFSRL